MPTSVDQVSRLANLLRTYKARQCLLFVGAGFSQGATRAVFENDDSKSPPLGRLLTSLMQRKLDSESQDLGDLADEFQQRFGEHGLLDFLHKNYIVSQVSENQKQICSYNWKEVYTTNYDNVLELSCTAIGKQYTRIGYSEQPKKIDFRTVPIVHINGYVDGVNIKTFTKEIRLSNIHYMSDDFSRSAWGERFRSDLYTSPCIVFAGYSMYDLDIARVLKSHDQFKDRTYFIVSEKPSASELRKLSSLGTVLSIGIDGFSEIIRNIPRTENLDQEPSFVGWTKIEVDDRSSNRVLDRDVINFIMSGHYEDSTFAHDVITGSFKLSFLRDAVTSIVSLIEDRNSRYYIVTSNIGNGKTTSLRTISYILSRRGYRIFVASSRNELILREVSKFRQVKGPLVIILDNIASHREVAAALVALGRDDLFVVTSARTYQYEFQKAEIHSVFGDDLVRFSLDSLSQREVQTLVEFFQLYGLWGKRHALPQNKKIDYIVMDCGRELRTVILDVLDSPNIKTRIENMINIAGETDAQRRLHSVLVISQLLQLGNLDCEIRDVDEILDENCMSLLTKYRSHLSDFSFLMNGKLVISSSILSEYILRNLIETGFVVDLMVRSMQRLDYLYDNDDYYRDVYKVFSRFSFVESAISESRRRTYLVAYFEQLKDLRYCRDESLFWLQYAMARMSLGQYWEAKNNFDVAYAIANKRGYKENRHLDNQYARFLLESRIRTDTYDDYMIAFNKAHSICARQMKSEPDSYNPYRVAGNYREFIERRISHLQAGDLVSLFRSCTEVQRHVTNANPSIKNSLVVNHCGVEINKSISMLRARLTEIGVQI